eukprot:1517335-Pyramimonas_sp.AAC.1
MRSRARSLGSGGTGAGLVVTSQRRRELAPTCWRPLRGGRPLDCTASELGPIDGPERACCPTVSD